MNWLQGMMKRNDGVNRGVSPSSLGKAKKNFKKMKIRQRPADTLHFPTTICKWGDFQVEKKVFSLVWSRPGVKAHLKPLFSFPPSQSVSWHSNSTICDPLGPPSGPQTNPKCTHHDHIFLCPCPKWLVWDPTGVKAHLKCLCHFHLPSWYPDSLTQPSVTLGATLSAQNQPKMHPT